MLHRTVKRLSQAFQRPRKPVTVDFIAGAADYDDEDARCFELGVPDGLLTKAELERVVSQAESCLIEYDHAAAEYEAEQVERYQD